MVKILQLFLVTVGLIIVEIFCSRFIGNILSEYYESELVKSFKEEWVKYRKGFETAVMTNLQENYGTKSMNIYMRNVRDARKITKGFYLSDNTVNILFTDMILRDWPNLIMPDVSLCLPGNILKVETTVSKMFVDTTYMMSRNASAVLYSSVKLDKTKHSPFSLQQVHSEGKLTITAEDCFLSGFSIVTLLGNSVALGHSTFRLVDCKFTVEISSDVGTPPVIAPYFPKGPGKQIESLLSGPVRDELVQTLQGAMYSYINTSVAFGKRLREYKLNQQKLFKQTSNYLSGLCERLNNLTLEEQKGTIDLSDFEERLQPKDDVKRSSTYLSLKELKLYGLDTAYASRTGGSFEASQLSIAEGIRFHALQIRGKLFYDNGTESNTHNFAAELNDATVNVIVNIEKEGSKSVHKFDVLLARTFDFSVLPWETSIRERLWYQSLVSGYINNEVPARIAKHLSRVLTPAADDKEQDELILYGEFSEYDEVTKKNKIPSDNDSPAESTNIEEENNSELPEKSQESNSEAKDDEPEELPEKSQESNSEAKDDEPEDLSEKSQERDILVSKEVRLESGNSADDSKLAGSLISDVAAPDSDFQISDGKKDLGQPDVVLGTDSGDKENKQLFSDIMSVEIEKGNLPGYNDKTGEVIDKNFFSDDAGKKAFFSDPGDGKMLVSDGDGEKYFVKSENEGDNNNPKMLESKKGSPVLIFASPENDDDNAEHSVQPSVPIERAGKNSHIIAHNAAVNRKKPITRTHNRNKKESNNLKLSLRRNPRINTIKATVSKMTSQKAQHVQTSEVHNKTSVPQNDVHMSDNEIR